MALTVALRYGGIALQFVILMILARRLDPEDYGRYLLVLSAVLPTYFLLGLGVSETFVRDAPKLEARGEPDQVRALLGTTLTFALANAAVVALTGGLLLSLLPLDTSTWIQVAFILAFFVANGLMFNGAQLLLGVGAKGLGAFFFYPAVNLSLAVSAVPYVVLAHQPTFSGVALATSVASLIVAAFALLLVVRRVRPGPPSIGVTQHLVRVGLRLSAARGLYAAGIWLPTFIAGLALSPVQAGYLGTAGRLAVAVGAITAAVRFAIRPTIVRAFEAQDRQAIKLICGRLATVTLVITLAAVVVSSVAGHWLISAAFGADLAPAAPLLTVLLVAVAIEAYAGPIDEVLKMTGHENRVLAIFCVAVPLATVALLGVAHWGVMAMAWVQVLYTLAVFGSMIVVLHRYWGIWIHPILPGSRTVRAGSRDEI